MRDPSVSVEVLNVPFNIHLEKELNAVFIRAAGPKGVSASSDSAPSVDFFLIISRKLIMLCLGHSHSFHIGRLFLELSKVVIRKFKSFCSGRCVTTM